MTCIVRADAGPAIGGGHLMRCLALALAYRAAGGDVVFLSSCDSERLRARVRAAGFRLVDAAASHPDPVDASAAVALAQEVGAGWVVVDGYHFDFAYHAAMRAAGLRVLAIADMVQWQAYDVDILLDQNVDAPHLAFPVGDETRVLVGPRFALLRPEFAAARGSSHPVPGVAQRLLVTLGAGAPGDGRGLVLEALGQVGLACLEVRIVVGPADPALETLGGSAGVTLVADPPDLPGLMAWADLAVSNGGITSWELACLGVPTLQLVLAENQRGIASEMARLGLARCLGEVGAVEPTTVAAGIRQAAADGAWRNAVARSGPCLVDGRGAERVVRAMRADIARAAPLALRPATQEDALFLWGLANGPGEQPERRRPTAMSLESFFASAARPEESSATRTWILDRYGVAAGAVRYDRTSPEAAEVDFAVLAPYCSRGFGGDLLLLANELACAELGVRLLRAEVLASNVAARRALEVAGFVCAERTPEDASTAVEIYERAFA